MRYVIVDIETTGLFVNNGDRIIEIGAVAVDGDVMGEEFQSLIYTDKPITKGAKKVHGITAEMLAGQPEAKEVLSVFRQFVGSNTLVAHNAPFDVGFLQWECMRVGLIFSSRHRCTLKMSRKHVPRKRGDEPLQILSILRRAKRALFANRTPTFEPLQQGPPGDCYFFDSDSTLQDGLWMSVLEKATGVIRTCVIKKSAGIPDPTVAIDIVYHNYTNYRTIENKKVLLTLYTFSFEKTFIDV